MENKRSCNVNDILAKDKCINDFFSNDAGSGGNSMIHRWMLMSIIGICGATGGVNCVDIKWGEHYES